MEKYLIYNGHGFLPGIPARDLTRLEFDALDKDQRKAVLECGSYESALKKKDAPIESAKE